MEFVRIILVGFVVWLAVRRKPRWPRFRAPHGQWVAWWRDAWLTNYFVKCRYEDSWWFRIRALSVSAWLRPEWMSGPWQHGLCSGWLSDKMCSALEGVLQRSCFCRVWSRIPVGGYAGSFPRRTRPFCQPMTPHQSPVLYIVGLSRCLLWVPWLRAGCADHELVHMIQHATHRHFTRERYFCHRPLRWERVLAGLWLGLKAEFQAGLMGQPGAFFGSICVGVYIFWYAFAGWYR